MHCTRGAASFTLQLLPCNAGQCLTVPACLCALCVCRMMLMTTSSSSDDDSDTEAPAAKKAKTSSPVREDEMAD
jgi:hypothetical protein